MTLGSHLNRTLQRTRQALGLDALSASAAAAGELSGRRLLGAAAGFTGVLLVVSALFARLVVQDFGAPLSGRGDLSLWDHQNHYVASNLTFTPLPRLGLHNDQLFYPYGGNNVFQPWIMEMHLMAASATRLLGTWGWSQLYFLLSVAVTALGAFLLLVRDHGAWRAGTAALAVSCCNYYAIGRYAGALANACVHWTVLGVLADFVLVSRAVARRPWSARLLATRAFLLVACLGLDLGYVAGIGLTSAAITACVLATLTLARARFRPTGLRSLLSVAGLELLASARAHPVQVALLAGMTALAALVYVPLAVQVAEAAREYDFSRVSPGGWWANPLRLLMPVLPGFNPVTHHRILGDQPEAMFAASPGLAFVLAALAGLAAGRRRILAALPGLVLLALFLSFHPLRFDSLRLLPWFGFVRVSARFSVVYPALLASLALLTPPGRWRWPGRVTAVLLAALLGVEATTAYRSYLIKDWHHFRPDAAFTGLMQAIRSAPGEAVLDWPFCVAGGNGVATNQICRYYGIQSGTAWLQTYHGKKVVGKYFGRLHPDQVRPYIEAGWPRLFVPDNPNAFKARRQQRDFAPQEWEFVERFVTLGDFSGVLLYTDLLPPETVAGFHARFGPPVAAAGSLFGRIEFIPKPGAWRGQVDLEAARRLALPRPASDRWAGYRTRDDPPSTDHRTLITWPSRPARIQAVRCRAGTGGAPQRKPGSGHPNSSTRPLRRCDPRSPGVRPQIP
jgi:hypothetical protein